MANEPVQDTDPTIGRLVSDASRDVSSLLRNEIQLAKSELRLSAKAGGVGIASQIYRELLKLQEGPHARNA